MINRKYLTLKPFKGIYVSGISLAVGIFMSLALPAFAQGELNKDQQDCVLASTRLLELLNSDYVASQIHPTVYNRLVKVQSEVYYGCYEGKWIESIATLHKVEEEYGYKVFN